MSVKVRGLNRTVDRIKATGDRMIDMRPVGKEILQYIGQKTEEHIDKGNFPKVTKKYAEYKIKKVGHLKPLVFTGELRGSLSRKGNRYSVKDIHRNKIIYGSKLKYISHLVNQNRDPFTADTKSIRAFIKKILLEYIVRGNKRK